MSSNNIDDTILFNHIYKHKDGGTYRTLRSHYLTDTYGKPHKVVEYESMETKEVYFRTVEHFKHSFKLKEE